MTPRRSEPSGAPSAAVSGRDASTSPRVKAKLHSAVSPGEYGWVGAGPGSGKGGLTFNYVVGQHRGGVELYIDRGQGGVHENMRIFESLLEHREDIGQKYGGALSWEPLEGKRACASPRDARSVDTATRNGGPRSSAPSATRWSDWRPPCAHTSPLCREPPPDCRRRVPPARRSRGRPRRSCVHVSLAPLVKAAWHRAPGPTWCLNPHPSTHIAAHPWEQPTTPRQ